jgi:hypothetical protein
MPGHAWMMREVGGGAWNIKWVIDVLTC